MRNLLVALLVMAIVPFTLPAQEPAAGEGKTSELMEELRKTTQKLDELSQRLERIEKQLKEQQEQFANSPFGRAMARPQMKTADLETLNKIELPENPTKEQVRQYVRKILDATAGQNARSSNDPQPGMYERVGKENLDVLIDSLGSHGDYHLEIAIQKLVTEEHKTLLIGMLARRPATMKFIEKFGWERDARDELLKGLREGPPNLPATWSQAVAGFNDPQTYDALLSYLARCEDPYPVYEAVKELKDIDLDEAVTRAWRNLKGKANQRGPFGLNNFVDIAVAHGNTEALEMLIDNLEQEHFFMMRGPFGQKPSPRRVVLKHIEFHGTNKEIKEWYEKNVRNIHFDKQKRLFVVMPSAA